MVPRRLLCAILVCAWLATSVMGETVELRVDCSKVTGEIRPLHGGNSGPLTCGGIVDLSAYHRELGIPFTRLHDCHWPNPDVVDIHAVFPDFKADPSLPESYDFRRTDEYIQAIVNVGSKIVYRLGESIEHTRTKYHVHPPTDYDKWAAVCIGIIRHYNEGWGNGFRFNIQHWEIWNEPENRPQMWTGNDDDYFRLYVKTAKAIKARFPDLQVGGPAIGYGGPLKDGEIQTTPFLKGFLECCKRESAPLDFFSWHWYTADPSVFAAYGRGVRALLDKYGFTKTASHLNEWNYLPRNDWKPILLEGQGLLREKCYAEMGGAPGAAFVAYVLMSLQDSPVDVANFYTAETQGFGLFTCDAVPKKTFYAFKAFKMLLDTPVRVNAFGGQVGCMAICAGISRDKSAANVLVSHFETAGEPLNLVVNNLPWDGATTYELLIVDAERELKVVRKGKLDAGRINLTGDLKAPSVGLVRLRKAGVNE